MEIRWYRRTNFSQSWFIFAGSVPSFSSCLGLDPKAIVRGALGTCGSSKGAIEIDERKISWVLEIEVERQLLDLCNSEVKKKGEGWKGRF